MDIEEKFILGIIATLMIAVSGGLGLAVYKEYQKVQLQRQIIGEVAGQFREIPKCDKTTWERVTEGCGE